MNTPAPTSIPANSPSPDAIQTELETVRRTAQADGGDIEFVSYDAGVVQVRFLGACIDCPSNVLTLKAGVESRLMGTFPQIKKVELITDDDTSSE
jgi:Fe-S cluster biogenesis protein NfuA